MSSNLLEIKLRLEGSQYDAAVNSAGAATDKFTGKAKVSLGSVKTAVVAGVFAFNQMATAVQTVARVAEAAFRPIAQAQSQMAEVASLGVENIGELNTEIQQLGQDIPKPLGDLRAGLYQVVSAGVDASAQIEVLGVSAKAAKAGLADTTDALNLGAAVIKGYGKSWGEFEGVMDQAFATVKLGQTTFPELAGSIGAVVPLASAMKVETTELFGAFATLTGVTGNTSEVAIQLRGVMASLAQPTKDMVTLVKAHGYATVETAVAQEGLAGILGMVGEATGGSAEATGKYFTRIEAVNAAIALSTTQYDTLVEKSEAMTDATGAMTDAFEVQNDTLESQVQLLKNQFTVVMEQLGEGALPAANAALQAVSETLTYLQENFRPLVEQYGPDASRIMGELGSILSNLSKILGKELLYVLNKSIEGWMELGKVLEPLLSKVSSLIDKIAKDFPDAVKATEDPLQKLKDGLDALDPAQVDKAIQSLAKAHNVTSPAWWNALAMSQGYSAEQLALLKERADAYTKSLEAANAAGGTPTVATGTTTTNTTTEAVNVQQNIGTTYETAKTSGEKWDPSQDMSDAYAQINALRDADQINDQEYYQARIDLAQEWYDTVVALEGEQSLAAQEAAAELNLSHQDAAAATAEAWGSAVGGIVGNLATLMGSAQSTNKTMFAVGKAAAMAEATYNTYDAAVAAYKSVVGIPIVGPVLAVAAATAATAAGLANVARIKATKFESRDSGGPVTAGSLYYSGVPEYFIPNENGFALPASMAAQSGSSGNVPMPAAQEIDYERLANQTANAVKNAMKDVTIVADLLDGLKRIDPQYQKYIKETTLI